MLLPAFAGLDALPRSNRWGGRLISTRPPGLRPRGFGGLGEHESDVARLQSLLSSLGALEAEIRSAAGSAPLGSALSRNGPAYAQQLLRARQSLSGAQAVPSIMAGGAARENYVKQMDAADLLANKVFEMYLSDSTDSSGARSLALAKDYYLAARAEAIRRGDSATNWERSTDWAQTVADFVKAAWAQSPFGSGARVGGLLWVALAGLGLYLLAPAIGAGLGAYAAGRRGR